MSAATAEQQQPPVVPQEETVTMDIPPPNGDDEPATDSATLTTTSGAEVEHKTENFNDVVSGAGENSSTVNEEAPRKETDVENVSCSDNNNHLEDTTASSTPASDVNCVGSDDDNGQGIITSATSEPSVEDERKGFGQEDGGDAAKPLGEAETLTDDSGTSGDIEPLQNAALESEQLDEIDTTGLGSNDHAELLGASAAPKEDAAVEKQPLEEDAGDDFGDFQATVSSSDPDGSVEPLEAINATEATINNDSEPVLLATSSQENDGVQTMDEEDDEFGDFGQAAVTDSPKEEEAKPMEDSTAEPTTTLVPPLPVDANDVGQEQAAALGSVETEDDDGFGDFGQATSEDAQEDEDDEFGDFGEATAATPLEKSVPSEGPKDGAQPTTTAEEDDDSFGDFDGANTSEAVATTQPPPEDEDDDFGDFVENPQVAEEGGAAITASSQQQQTAMIAGEGDDVVLKQIRHVIPRLFSQFAPDSEDAISDDQSSPAAETTVQSAISFLENGQNVDQVGDNDSSNSIHAKLGFLGTATAKSRKKHSESATKRIWMDDDKNPFRMFAYPIVGRRQAAAVLSGAALMTRRESVVPSYAEPARFEDETRTPSEAVAAEQQSQQEAEDRTTAFLQQIPDLSFMLSSQLQLPNSNED